MTGTADRTDRGHPISVGLSRIGDDLKTVRDAPAWSMSAEETRTALVEATRLGAQLSELEARLAHHGQTVEVEAESGATSTANWWAHATRQTRPAAHRKTRLAAALASEVFEPVRVGLAEGRLLVDQAQVIIAAVEALPDHIAPAITDDALGTLIGYAADYDAQALRILGRRILDVVAPEVGEAHEAEVLDARSGTPKRPRCSGCTRTATARPTGGSPSPPTWPRSCAGSCSRSPRRGTAPTWTAEHRSPAGRRRTGWGRRSASWSWVIPPSTPRRRVAPRPPWW